jgi:RNA polymerase sigma-70 factor (ECF subfamily)
MQRFSGSAPLKAMSTEPDRSPDDVLIRRFLGGDEAAFRQLYRRHTPRLRMMVLRLVGYQDADADDVVQEAWLACCQSLHAFRGDAQFATWLATIGVRAAKRRMARALAEPAPLPDSDLVDAQPTWPVTFSDAAIDAERLLRRLSERARIVFTLHVLEGLSHDEIARELDVAPGTSRAILSRALTSLRTYLHVGVSHGE